MGKRKERAVRYFIIFMLLMLACTIISRGIYASRMPKVALGTIDSQVLVRKIEADGTALTKEEVPVVTQAGLLVEKIGVVEGQKVSVGDALFWISLEDLDNLMRQADAQIRTEEAKLAELNASGNTAVNRANQDLTDTTNDAAGRVNGANEAFLAAQAAMDAFPSEEDYKNHAYEQDVEYQKLWKASQKKKATKEAKQAFSDYKKSLAARLAQDYAAEKQALNDAVTEKERALNDAKSEQNEAIKQAKRTLEDAKNGGDTSGAKLEQQNQIRQLKENREKLLALKQTEGKVLCQKDGYVNRISIQAGERTTDASALVLSDASGEKLFQAVLPQEEKAYVAAGDKMNLTFSNGGEYVSGVMVDAVGELEDGSCQITGKISNANVTIGEIGKMQITKETGRYSCCIPLSALHSDGGSQYVLLVEEQETVLGTELIARKRKVKVLDQDEEYAALEDGTLTDMEQFIVDSDKEVKDGARIRQREGQRE